ncbi:unnamed protein product [Rotaria sordida]|uniref:Uncharacterized protein n=1 Tax=Rotaria sordida TaxID=392033 RepID=A0A819ULV7_9BILA|nr:unnamed protein product [Rotaria sordida]CAF4097467.1 unnamed protein product [Rotaria sordida]
MAGSYFRVSEVRRDEKHIWYVRLAILRIFDNPLDSNSKFGALYDYMLSRSVHPMCINRSDIGVVLFQSDSPQVYKAHCIVGLGNLSLIEQKFERANAHYQKALSLFDKYLPVGHPDQSRVRQKIANIVHIYRRKPAMALEDYEDCLENYLRSLPSDHVAIARVYTDMARSYEQLPNELDKALEYAKKAAIIFEQNLPKVHTDNVTIHMIIKRIQRKLTLEQ